MGTHHDQWKGVNPQVFFDPSTPSKRKVDNREEKEKDCENSDPLNFVASPPPEQQLTLTLMLVPKESGFYQPT